MLQRLASKIPSIYKAMQKLHSLQLSDFIRDIGRNFIDEKLNPIKFPFAIDLCNRKVFTTKQTTKTIKMIFMEKKLRRGFITISNDPKFVLKKKMNALGL